MKDATAILAEFGITGGMDRIAGRYHLHGTIGAEGVDVSIEGEPDEAFIRDAAKQMREALEG